MIAGSFQLFLVALRHYSAPPGNRSPTFHFAVNQANAPEVAEVEEEDLDALSSLDDIILSVVALTEPLAG